MSGPWVTASNPSLMGSMNRIMRCASTPSNDEFLILVEELDDPPFALGLRGSVGPQEINGEGEAMLNCNCR